MCIVYAKKNGRLISKHPFLNASIFDKPVII